MLSLSTSRAVLVAVALASALNRELPGAFVGDVGFNVVRVAIALAGGWLTVRRASASLWVAAFAGVLVLIVDHVLLKGGWYLLAQWLWPLSVNNQGILAFAGVVGSFVMFAPIAALVGFTGGVFARKVSRGANARP